MLEAATVTDNFPTELTCTYTSLASGNATGNTLSGNGDINDMLVLPLGSSVTYTATCVIDESATGTLSNTVNVTSPTTDPNPGDESDTVDVPVVAATDLSISKTDGETVLLPGFFNNVRDYCDQQWADRSGRCPGNR